MFTLNETKYIAPHIAQAYSSDPALVEKWHVIAGAGLEACIERTIQDLKACSSLRFYSVHDGDSFVGYFGTEFDGLYMPTIYIAKSYRDRKDLFWKDIEKKVRPIWKAGIYSKNTPCMKFYAKHGKFVSAVTTPDGEVSVFEFRST